MAFHRTTAQLLFLSARARQDIQPATAFLTTRVRSPNEDNWGKVKRVLGYLKGTLHMPLILSADSLTLSAASSWHPPMAARLERDRGNLSGQPREGGDDGLWSTGQPCVLTTMPMRTPKIGHVVASTGRTHNSRCQVVLRRRWNIDSRGRTNRLDHHISVSNGAEPVVLLARFHRNFNG